MSKIRIKNAIIFVTGDFIKDASGKYDKNGGMIEANGQDGVQTFLADGIITELDVEVKNPDGVIFKQEKPISKTRIKVSGKQKVTLGGGPRQVKVKTEQT